MTEPLRIAMTDRSGTTSGTPGTSTSLMGANSKRQYFCVQNIHSTANLFINFTDNATQGKGSIKLTPGQMYEPPADVCTCEQVNICSDTASVDYTAKES